MPRKGYKFKQVSIEPEDFVVAWQTSKTVKEVAELLGISEDAAKLRASRLRKWGVKLKQMKPIKYHIKDDKLRIAQLNSLVNKHGGKV